MILFTLFMETCKESTCSFCALVVDECIVNPSRVVLVQFFFSLTFSTLPSIPNAKSSIMTKGTALATLHVYSRMIPLYTGKVEEDSIFVPAMVVH